MMALSDMDQETIAFIYQKYYKKMLYDAAAIVGHEQAPEVVHDVFVKLIEKFKNNIDTLRDKPSRFFIIVNRNLAIDFLRKRSGHDAFSLDDECFESEFQDLELTPEDIAIDADEHRLLVQLIKRLNPTMREILEYSVLVEYSNQEIAKLLQLPETTVSTRLSRAKQKLRELIEKKEEDNLP